MRIFALLSGLGFASFIGLDAVHTPERLPELLVTRLSYTAATLTIFGATFLRRRDGLPRIAPAVLARITMVACLVAMVATAALTWDAHPTGVAASYLMMLLAVVALFPFGVREMTAWLCGLAATSIGATLWIAPALAGPMADMASIVVFVILTGAMMARRNQRLRREAADGRARTEALLLNMLPHDIADELREHGRVEARDVDDCTILFSDFVGFTSLSARVDAAELVSCLDRAFVAFDNVTAAHGLEKLKTIGDAYMCAGGVIDRDPDHLRRCLDAGLGMLAALQSPDLRDPEGNTWSMRLGLHSGPVVAGVIGRHKFAFDLWGDTVNMAARAESAGRAGGVCMTADLFATLPSGYVAEPLGSTELKGKGAVDLVLVTARDMVVAT